MSLNLDRSMWKRITLDQVAAASKENVNLADGTIDRYIAGEHMDSNDLTIHRWGSIGDVDLGPAFHRRFRPGQVLYGSRRTYLRKVAVADFDGVCANTTFVVETRNPKVLLQEFLPFIMMAEPFHAFAIAESKGSVNPYVNWTDIERYEFDLPPIEEQKRLVKLLWAVERSTKAIIDLAKLNREIISTFIDVKIQTMFDDPSINKMILGEIMHLDSVTQAVSSDMTYRIAGVLNQGKGLVDKGNVKGSDIAYTRLTNLKAGQVVMRKLTAWEGPIQIVPSHFDGAWVSNEFPAFTVNEMKACSLYLEMIFTWPQMWALMKSKVQGSVQRRMRLSPEQLLSVTLPFPQIPVQQEIATTWNELKRVADVTDKDVKALGSSWIPGS